MKVAILTEGDGQIGLGHVTRCTSIYQAFKERNIEVEMFINGNINETSVSDKLPKDLNYYIINWMNQKVLQNILENSDIVLIDSYFADLKIYSLISKNALGIYIDDNNRLEYPQGIVANGSINAENLNYSPKKDSLYLLGTEYTPLRNSFSNYSSKIPSKENSKSIKTIMITLGGGDNRNLTPKILKMLLNNYPTLKINVIIGAEFNNISEIEPLASSKIKLIYHPDAEGMVKTMINSDIAISGGGQTIYELACMGLPSITILVASNQEHNIEYGQKAGFLELAGSYDDKNLFKKISDILGRMDFNKRQKMAQQGMKAVDGFGSQRIIDKAINYYVKNFLKIRKANCADLDWIYELSNDDTVRKNSFNQNHILFDTHQKWFKSKINKHNNVFLIGELGDDRVGQVRFEITNSCAQISISIDPEYRKLGIGSMLLHKSLNIIRNEYGVDTVRAFIKTDNKTSKSLFEKCGFKFNKELHINDTPAYEYHYALDQ